MRLPHQAHSELGSLILLQITGHRTHTGGGGVGSSWQGRYTGAGAARHRPGDRVTRSERQTLQKTMTMTMKYAGVSSSISKQGCYPIITGTCYNESSVEDNTGN